MKNSFLFLFMLCLATHPCVYAQTYTLNWGSAFAPAWTNGETSGTASNAGGSGLSVTVGITKSGGIYSHSNGSTGVTTPTVSGSSFTVGGSSANLEIAMDFNSNSEHADIVYHFSMPVTHVVFEIADIDKPAATGTQYFDEVVVSGTDGTVSHLPTLTKYNTSDPDFLIISGNTAYASTTSGHGGNSASSATDQKGTVIVNFGANAVTSISIRYKNATGAQADPLAQGIAIGNLSFQKPVPVPVKFTYVRAKAAGSQSLIEWQTAMEHKNSHFEIERSTTGNLWSKIGTVTGAGTTSEVRTYSFLYPETSTEIVHYRIRQVDEDGRSSYSIIVSITHTRKHFTADVYPNPVDAFSVITLYVDRKEEIAVTITDAMGKTHVSDIWPVYKGANTLSFSEFGRLSKGYYTLHLYVPKTGHKKIIKLLKL